jgi:hypothetical protein
MREALPVKALRRTNAAMGQTGVSDEKARSCNRGCLDASERRWLCPIHG